MRRLVIAITVVVVGLVVWKASQQRFGTTDVQITEELVRPGPADADAPREFTTTDSGLEYRILRKSDQQRPIASDTVLVHYRGWLDSGKVFDSSYRRGKPHSMNLKEVIPGWTEALQLVGKGGMIELIIPPRLGYGSRGSNDIPANSTLHFLIELFDIGIKKETNQANAEEEKDVLEPGPADADAPSEFTAMSDGGKFRTLRKSSGRKPTTLDWVSVHIRSYDDSGKRLFSTYRREEPQERPLGMFPKQVQEVLKGTPEGGMVEIIVPRKSNTDSKDATESGKYYRFVVELFKVVAPPTSAPIDADAPNEYTMTESGLQYRVMRKSEGTRPQYGDRVQVHYRMWFEGGGEVENSYTGGAPFQFTMGGEVVKGWQEGLQHVGEGGMIELIVPPQLGYGVLGSPPKIPGDTTLHFAIEVLKVN